MRFKKVIPFVFVITAFSLISWGVIGHRTLGKIAQNHLSPKAKVAVLSLLGSEDMPIVSTFADEIRYEDAYIFTAPWHYLNLPEGLNYETFSARVKTDTAANVYNALLKMQAQLKNPKSSKEDKTFALKMLIHFVGDLHQPMHISRGHCLR
jgi:hypothetical protein